MSTPTSGSGTAGSSGGSSGGGSTPSGTSGGGSGTTSAAYMYLLIPSQNPQNPQQSTLVIDKIDENSGALTQIASGTVPSVGSLLAVDSSGKNVFVVGNTAPGPNMDLVKVDPGAGTISPFPGQTFHAVPPITEGDCCPSAIAVDPAGKFAYVGGLNDGSVHVFSVDQSTGVWKEIAPENHESGGNVYEIALDPSNNFLYSSNRSSSDISAWARDPNTGLLSPAAGAPFGTAGHTSSVSLSADSKFAFVPHYELANLEVFKVGSDGSFNAVPGSPFPGGNAASYAISDPANKFVFLLNPSGYNQSGTESISVYKLDDTSGTLTQVQGSPFGLTAEGSHLRIDPSGKFLYVVGDILQGFSVDQNSGKLSALSGSPMGIKVADAAIVKQ